MEIITSIHEQSINIVRSNNADDCLNLKHLEHYTLSRYFKDKLFLGITWNYLKLLEITCIESQMN